MADRFIDAGLHRTRERGHEIVGGDGVWLRRADGSELLDASNTGGPLGHAHPAMVEAVTVAAGAPVVNEGKPWGPREEAARELVEVAFGDEEWVGGVRFGLSGSEVNDIALSLAQAATGRSSLVARERAYHGLVGLSRDVTVQPQWHGGLSELGGAARKPNAGSPVRVVAGPDGGVWRRDGYPAPSPWSVRELEEACAGAAAVIVDYTQGGRYYEAAYQDAVAEASRRAGAWWIADEVVTGLGRSGHWMAFHGAESRPDLVTLGKPIAGGSAAAGAVVLSRRAVELLDSAKWQNYSTFRGHPVTIAAIRAHLRTVADEGLVERAARGGERMRVALIELASRHRSVVRVAGEGLHWTVELAGVPWQRWVSTTEDRQLSDVVVAEAMRRGVAMSTSDEPSSIFLAPPLIVTDEQLDRIVETLDAGLKLADEEIEG